MVIFMEGKEIVRMPREYENNEGYWIRPTWVHLFFFSFRRSVKNTVSTKIVFYFEWIYKVILLVKYVINIFWKKVKYSYDNVNNQENWHTIIFGHIKSCYLITILICHLFAETIRQTTARNFLRWFKYLATKFTDSSSLVGQENW